MSRIERMAEHLTGCGTNLDNQDEVIVTLLSARFGAREISQNYEAIIAAAKLARQWPGAVFYMKEALKLAAIVSMFVAFWVATPGAEALQWCLRPALH